MFRCSIPNIRWITATLETLEFKNLQQITIRLYPTTLVELTEGANHRDLQDLDRMLVQLWISHSIRPLFVYVSEDGEKDMRGHVLRLLPELTRRGLVDVVG